MTDDQQTVIAATRRAWLGRKIADVLPQYDLDQASEAIRQRRAGLTVSANGNELLGYAGILMGGGRDELRPSRTGSLFLAYDLEHYKAEARAQVIQQSIYWAGWVTALALAMWLVFHFVITRRTARLVGAAEQIAAGNLAARSGLKGTDELGRLSRSFDAMALEVAETQTRLRQDIAERARVQRQLEESETRLQQILDNATAVVCVKDTAGAVPVRQPPVGAPLPFQAERRRGANRARLPSPKTSRARFAPTTCSCSSATRRWSSRRPRASTTACTPTSRTSSRCTTRRGVAYGVCTISTDITERKRADEALRISEASYRAIFDAAEDGIFVHDIETGAIVDANPRACALFGYTLDELRDVEIGTLGSGATPYTQDDAMAIFARAVAGEDIRIEWQAKRKDGALRWVEIFGKRVTIGGHDRILALARDITDRKCAEEALCASEEQYRAMFNASIDGVALWTSDGGIVDTNPALRRMYGYDDAEFAALPDRSLGGSVAASGFPARRRRRPSAALEMSGRRKDGSVLDLEVHGVPMQYQGKPHVLTITRDITENKRAAAELARQRESSYQREKLAALGSLLAGVSHELNNPLSVVVARAVLLEERGDGADAGRGDEDPHGRRALRAHRAHLPRDGPATAARTRPGGGERRRDRRARHRGLWAAHERRGRHARPGGRASARACRCRPAAPGAPEPARQRPAIAPGAARAAPVARDEPVRRGRAPDAASSSRTTAPASRRTCARACSSRTSRPSRSASARAWASPSASASSRRMAGR